MTAAQIKALRAIGDAVVDAVSAAGNQGAPSGHLYAALMPTGITLEQYEGLMAGLVAAKMLTKQGQLYFATGRAI